MKYHNLKNFQIIIQITEDKNFADRIMYLHNNVEEVYINYV